MLFKDHNDRIVKSGIARQGILQLSGIYFIQQKGAGKRGKGSEEEISNAFSRIRLI